MNTAEQKIKKQFDQFMTLGFEEAVDSSTKASWGGSSYTVEITENSYRVLWSDDVGNLYSSPGIMLTVPSLSEDEWDEDKNIRFYDNAEERMNLEFLDALGEYIQQDA